MSLQKSLALKLSVLGLPDINEYSPKLNYPFSELNYRMDLLE